MGGHSEDDNPNNRQAVPSATASHPQIGRRAVEYLLSTTQRLWRGALPILTMSTPWKYAVPHFSSQDTIRGGSCTRPNGRSHGKQRTMPCLGPPVMLIPWTRSEKQRHRRFGEQTEASWNPYQTFLPTNAGSWSLPLPCILQTYSIKPTIFAVFVAVERAPRVDAPRVMDVPP